MELYNIKKDPEQMNNLAGNSEYSEKLAELKAQLQKHLSETGDPRSKGLDPWQDYPFYAGEKYLKGQYLEEFRKR